MAHYYFLINNNATNLAQIRTDCFLRHAISTNNQNELSEVLSFSGDERLIKVADVTQEWLDSKPWVIDTNICLWYYPQGDEVGTGVIQAWTQAQEPEFDSTEDEIPDSNEERKSWWQRLLGL